MDILVTICARGGSKGIPGKNTRTISGIPLIAYTIHQAQQFAQTFAADIALSTESENILNVASTFGLTTDYVRPLALADDETGKEAVIRDVMLHHEQVRGKRYDMVLDLDVTSPLRTQEELATALKMMEDCPEALDLFAVSQARRNPYFTMVEQNPSGFYSLSKVPEHPILRRQDAPKVYELNASLYYYRRAFFDQGWVSPYTDKSIIFEIPHVCFDLDEPIDFEFMEYLITNNKLDFDFSMPHLPESAITQ